MGTREQVRFIAHPCYTPAPQDLDHDDIALVELRDPVQVERLAARPRGV